MIDLHAHILYGVDDGARSRQMTLSMLGLAQRDGINTIVATPHYIAGANIYDPDGLEQSFNEAINLIKQNNLDINLYLGNELFLDEYILEDLKAGLCKTLAGTRYVLLELPIAGIPRYTEKVLYDFIDSGYRPILAHPERNTAVMDSPDVLKYFIEMGCITQINSTSIIGASGSRIRDMSRMLLESSMGHLVASDCHSDKRRSPVLTGAYKIAAAWLGSQRADGLFFENPEKVLKDDKIDIEKPEIIHRKKGIVERLKGCFKAAR